MNGGAGDDTLVWNNGDGNDHMNGDDGLDRIEDNLGAANDISQLKVVAGKVHYARDNAPFTLDVATSEVFELNTFGGNDTLDIAPGVGALIAVTVDAGSGDDRSRAATRPTRSSAASATTRSTRAPAATRPTARTATTR